MSRFRDVELAWGGKTYVLPSNKLMAVIMRVEDTITLAELVAALSQGRPPMARIATAYSEVLRYAGCQVTDEDVYIGLFKDNKDHENAMKALSGLLVLMAPPSDADIPFEVNGAAPVGNVVSPSPRKSTRRRSGAAG
jgi:hypothetical protein